MKHEKEIINVIKSIVTEMDKEEKTEVEVEMHYVNKHQAINTDDKIRIRVRRF